MRSNFHVGLYIHADWLSRFDYPSALELVIGGSKVLIAAARIMANGQIQPYVSELLVCFS